MELKRVNESFLLKNARYADALNENLSAPQDILVREGVFRMGESDERAKIIDCSSYIMTPSFIQMHTHLCQHIFKGLAEDVSLFDWLGRYIIKYESSMSREMLRNSARGAIHELIESGTTTIMDMGTFSHQKILIDEISDSGIVGYSGNVLMDREIGEYSNSLQDYIKEADELAEYAKGKRCGYALCPRFFPGITDAGINAIIGLQKRHGLFIHTHASETYDEVNFAVENYGAGNISAMMKKGMLFEKCIVAHCIHISDEEKRMLAESGATAVHCPSANMKLGSGTADVPGMIEKNVNVALGSDGAPCNNNMNQIFEMRLAGLLQKVSRGAESMPAAELFKMATVNGAKALGLHERKGLIREGYDADFILVDRNSVHIPQESANPLSSIIYSAYPSDIKYVFSEGRILKENGEVVCLDRDEILEERRGMLKNFLSDRL